MGGNVETVCDRLAAIMKCDYVTLSDMPTEWFVTLLIVIQKKQYYACSYCNIIPVR